jgi:4-amino-4-deoxy-L-arabinose transferase-like glycosyltransferase
MPSHRTPKARLAAIAILAIHAGLLAWGAYRHSITIDEMAYLPAGISHWDFGRFDLFCVNPPLVRVVAAAPLWFTNAQTDWSHYIARPALRSEFSVGIQFVQLNGYQSFWYYTLARWTCIPFSLLGGYVCYRWARELYGALSGILALALWCFCPNVIAHGQLITPDVGATSLGVTAAYFFWRWLKEPTWSAALIAGIALGLAELAKATWIVLFVLWPLLWLVWRWGARSFGVRRLDAAFSFSRGHLSGQEKAVTSPRTPKARPLVRDACQLAAILLVGVYVLNLGYGFEGSLERLGTYEFTSRALAGEPDAEAPPETPRNRFAGTWLGAVPVPLPKNYVLGIDITKKEFEQKKWSYLRGEWRFGGWWYYYLYALAIKVPLGTWLLVLLAACRPSYVSNWRDEMVLLAPLVVILVFVSSQTGYSHHLRYVLPAFPFAFIWAAKVTLCVPRRQWFVAALAATGLAWSVGSSLLVYPHSLSYFNELVGGPKGGIDHLGYSNLDWGQDLLYLKRWLDDHPEAQPLGLAYSYDRFVNPRIAGIESTLPPSGVDYQGPDAPHDPRELGPRPGWFAVSTNNLVEGQKRYAYFRRFTPAAMAGYSIYIYHITPEEANRVRRDLGLPALP